MQMPAFQAYTFDNGETIATFRSVLDASELAKKIGLHRVGIRMVLLDEKMWKAMA